jgi:adenylate cyclase
MTEVSAKTTAHAAVELGEVAAWLTNAGLRELPLVELIDGFFRRLNQNGVSVVRGFVGVSTLHPLLRAFAHLWDIKGGSSEGFNFAHADLEHPIWRLSPFARMMREGIPELRQALTVPETALTSPVHLELKADGMTEWYGTLVSFTEQPIKFGDVANREYANQRGVVCSFVTNQVGGFRDVELATLQRLLPLFALAVKATTLRSIGRGLLATYLGQDPADRVFAGTIFRGEVQSVEAVLFYADLRGFTELADTMPGQELVAMLDDYFDCMARPVVKRGGEILKFLGDGLLATFGIGGAPKADVCRTALDAASEAIADVAALNVKRDAAGQPFALLDLALHVGEVLYGNVGTDARLDFTVIGPAVNEASRIELLCKELGCNVLVSQKFATAATDCRDRLKSVGNHRLRGVRDKTELFTLLD